MQITASAVSLNVADLPVSAAFLISHFGFRQEMAADGFVSLAREDAGMNVVFLRRGLPLLPDDQRDTHAAGLILAFIVDLESFTATIRPSRSSAAAASSGSPVSCSPRSSGSPAAPSSASRGPHAGQHVGWAW